MDVRPSMEWVDFVNRQNFLQFHHECTHTFQEPRNLEYRYVSTVEFEGDMKDKRKYIPIRVLQSGEGCRQIWFLESKRLLQHHRLLWLFVWPFSFQLPISLSSYEVEYSPMRYKLKKYINDVRWFGVDASTDDQAHLIRLLCHVQEVCSFELQPCRLDQLEIEHRSWKWEMGLQQTSYEMPKIACEKSARNGWSKHFDNRAVTYRIWNYPRNIVKRWRRHGGLDRLSGKPWI